MDSRLRGNDDFPVIRGVLKSAALKIAQSPLQPDTGEAKDQRRQARFGILMRSHGMLAADGSKPKDGLVYQNELRAEWH